MDQSKFPNSANPAAFARSRRRLGAAYAAAVILSFLTLALYFQLLPWIGDRPVLMFFFFPIVISAYLGGLGPGLLATLISAAVSDYYLLPTYHSLIIEYPADVARWSIMLCFGVLVSALNEALHRSRRRMEADRSLYAVTLASIGDAVITTDETGRINFLNAEAERLSGWSRSEAIGRPLTEVFHIINEETRQAVENPVDKVLRTGSVVTLANHTILITHSGQEIFISDSAAPIRQKNGKIIGVVLVFRDCTAKKLAEEKLSDQERLLRIMGATARIGGWDFDPATGESRVTDEVARIHDVEPDTLKAPYAGLSFYLPASRARIEAAIKAASEHGTPYDLELELTTATGVRKWVRTIGQPVIRNGKTVRIQGSLQDITDRRQAEDNFSHEQARFKLIFDNLPIGIAFHTVQPDGTVIRNINDAHLRICGLTRAQHDEPGIYQRITHPEDRLVQERWNEKVAAGLVNRFTMEKRYLHPDGKLVWVNFSCQHEAYPGGTTEELTTVTDITERKLLEEQLRQSQKMEALGQLSGGIAHDFNNILTVIQGYCSLILLQPGLPRELQKPMKEIQLSADRAANLTRQLLAFSRHQTLQPRDLNLNEVLAGTTQMLQRLLGENISLQVTYSPQPLALHADAGMLDQILVNLAVNSRDAMPEGGRLTIETSQADFTPETAAMIPNAQPGQFVCLTVKDTGCGISDAILPRIFEPFFTTKGVGQGTGLGLATVYGIVEQHHGWIRVESQPGRGTAFQLYFPRLACELLKPADLPSRLASAYQGRETILLAEDDAALRTLIKDTLTNLGYRIIEAGDGVAARSLWREHGGKVRLLLTDLMMPNGVSGFDLARQIQREAPSLPVLYMSGYSPEIAGREIKLEDGVNFLPKPFDTAKLAQTIRACLDAAKAP
jgi:PAS domain S-box-containing protein